MQKGEETFGLRPQIIFICLPEVGARARAPARTAPHVRGRGGPPRAQPPCASPRRGRRRAARARAPASFTRQQGEACEEARATGELANQLDSQLAELREDLLWRLS